MDHPDWVFPRTVPKEVRCSIFNGIPPIRDRTLHLNDGPLNDGLLNDELFDDGLLNDDHGLIRTQAWAISAED